MAEIGTIAPEFTLPAHSGKPVNLGDYKGNRNVVLSFHIHSFTGG
jgi:peroxiredoxin